ncbi:MAG: hypothetical protein HY562_02835 [Ignavibacteriales bacterium]|nr:hypothetical protein [Ignavibacteriales bacterium]
MKKLALVGFSLVALIAFTDAVMSCPVCFGAGEASKTNDSVNMAVLVLLGITGGLLSLFGAFFVYLRKRMKMTVEGTFDYPSLN